MIFTGKKTGTTAYIPVKINITATCF